MKSLRWKLMLTTLVTVFLPVFFLNRYAVSYFDQYSRTALEKHMIEVALLVGDLVLDLPPEMRGDEASLRIAFEDALGRHGASATNRIQILSPGGRVLFDNGQPDELGRDLSGLPEIREAGTGRYKASYALTEDHSLMYYYCAQPILDGERVDHIVYVSRHTKPIVRAIRHMREDQRLATVWALGLAAMVAAIFAYTLTRRLRTLTRATRAFADGDGAAPIEVGGRDEIGELAAAFNRLGVELTQREAYNRTFMSTTLHELRAPITAIKGAAELLEQGAADKPDAREKFLGNIRYQADRLMRLVGELTELTRLDAESLRGAGQHLDYGATLAAIVERLQPGLEHRADRFVFQAPKEPIPVRAIPARLEQVIANVLENADRYTPEDGRITLHVRQQGGEVVTTVRDTGPGIAPANLDKVFERFFTTEPKDRYRGYGSGLGLAIARSIVEQHQGRMWVESLPGQGAAFHFTLPVATPA